MTKAEINYYIENGVMPPKKATHRRRKTVSKCECGHRLNYRTSPYMTTERRICPKCGRIHNVDYEPIDWARNFKAKNELFLGNENSIEARANQEKITKTGAEL